MNPSLKHFPAPATDSSHRLATWAKGALALGLIFTSGWLSRLPEPRITPDATAAGGGERFRFEAVPLEAPPGAGVGIGMVTEKVDGRTYLSRNVNPTGHHIRSWISSVGAAVAVEDLNGDGLPNDACWVCPALNRVVITHMGGAGSSYSPRFLDAPRPPASSAPEAPGGDGTIAPMGSIAGDFNEDGRMDLMVYYWGRTPVLFYRNETPWAADAPLANASFDAVELLERPERWFTNAATQADVDGDGHSDLILGNYFADGAEILDVRSRKPVEMQAGMSHSSNGGLTHILLWRADGYKAANIEIRRNGRTLAPEDRDASLRGWTLALAAANFDGNPRDLPGLYSANDFGPDVLLLPADGTGRNNTLIFDQVDGARNLMMPKSKVLGHDSFKGMGAYACDFDRDGIPDLSVSNIAAKWALLESHMAFRSGMLASADREAMKEDFGRKIREDYHKRYLDTGHIPLRDASEEMGLSRGGWGWEIKSASFDNRTDLQFLRATGFVHGHRLGRMADARDENRPPGPLAAGRWAVLHELATSNDVLLAFPKSWFPCQPGDDLSGRDRVAFLVADASGRYFDQNQLPQPFAGVRVEPPGGDKAARAPQENPLRLSMISRGIAIADVDGNGLPDFLVATQGMHQPQEYGAGGGFEKSYSFINRTPYESAGRCLQLRLLLPVHGANPETRVVTGPSSAAAGVFRGRPAIGATASLVMDTADGPAVFSGFVDGGNGHSGKNSFDIQFGLGDWPAGKPVRVLLRWRDPGAPGTPREEIREFMPGAAGDPGAAFRHTVLLKADTARP